MSLKNLWSLNIDETLVADQLKSRFSKKEYEVFLPINTQTKDIDLLFVRLKGYKVISIQVKGSRTYSPKMSEVKKYGTGSAAWFRLSKNSISDTANPVSIYVFVLHSFSDSETKKMISIDYLIIPSKDLIRIVAKKQMRKGDFYHFFIWIDTLDKRSFDFNNPRGNIIPLSRYLNNWDLVLRK